MKYVYTAVIGTVISWSVTWWIIHTFGAVGATVNGIVMGACLGAGLVYKIYNEE